MSLSQVEYLEIQEKKSHFIDSRAACIEALKIVQKYRGWVPDDAIYSLSDILNISASDVESVATFYSYIFRKPVGRYVIRLCDSVVCYINGYESIQKELEKQLNIQLGETTCDNKFTLLSTCCLGNCDKSPTLMINIDTYSYLTTESISILLEKYK